MTQRPPIPDPPYHGGCLCGAVRYRLDAPPLAINACHCDDCRKLTGAANLLMILAKRDQFHQESGAVDCWRKTADSGRLVDILRCKICGTRLWHEPVANPELIFIAAGTLDHSNWAVPTSHIWTRKAHPGTHFPSDALQVESQPASREMLVNAFTRLHPRR